MDAPAGVDMTLVFGAVCVGLPHEKLPRHAQVHTQGSPIVENEGDLLSMSNHAIYATTQEEMLWASGREAPRRVAGFADIPAEQRGLDDEAAGDPLFQGTTNTLDLGQLRHGHIVARAQGWTQGLRALGVDRSEWFDHEWARRSTAGEAGMWFAVRWA